MKTKIINCIIISIVTLTTIQFCLASNDAKTTKNVQVTYIANEGFLIEVENKSILIDALFGDKEYGFCDIPDSAQIKKMRNAENEFENIDLIAVTHRHVDHFYAPFVIDHLSNNKNGKIISCKQTINKIRNDDSYSPGMNSQLVEITPDSLTYIDTLINGIEVRVYRLIHGPYYVDDPKTGKKINRHRNIQNLGFLMNVNGVKIFHCGDSSPACKSDYEHFRLDNEKIDIAFLGRGFMWSADCKGIDIIRKYIKPEHIVLMHLRPERDKRFFDVAEEMKDEFLSVKVFENLMETKKYVIQ